jgi:hypothetical protein
MARFTKWGVGGVSLLFRRSETGAWRALGDLPGFHACPRGLPRAALEGLLRPEAQPSSRSGPGWLRCPVRPETQPVTGLEQRVKAGVLGASADSDLTAHLTPGDFVRAVYGVQDPISSDRWRDRVAEEARTRLRRAGFSGSAVHDQMERDDQRIRRFRAYVVQLANPGPALEEVAASVDEIQRADPFVPMHVAATYGIPGGKEVTIDGILQDRRPFRLRFLAFASGDLVYGLQLLTIGTKPEVHESLGLPVLDAAARPRDDLLTLALRLVADDKSD